MKFYQVYKNVSPLQMATSYMRRAVRGRAPNSVSLRNYSLKDAF